MGHSRCRSSRRAAVLCAALAACTTSGPPLGRVAAEANGTLRPFVLQPGDELSVRFRHNAEWDHETLVRPDRRAAFLFVDDLEVAGLTVAEVDERLTAAYVPRVARPELAELSVLVTALQPRTLLVMGEVQKPGEVVLREERVSFQEALGRAGGPLKRTARLESTVLVRYLPAEGAWRAWKVDASVAEWGAGAPLYLQADDVVFVPNTNIDDVDIWVDQHIRQLLPFPSFAPVVAGP